MAFSIRLTQKEERLAKDYAKLNGKSVGEVFREALFEKIEDEFDIVLAEQAYNEYEKNPIAYTLDDIKKEFDI